MDLEGEEEINVDSDSRPASPAATALRARRGPEAPRARLSFSISALLGDRARAEEDDDEDIHQHSEEEEEDEEGYEEGYDLSRAHYPNALGASLGALPSQYSPLAGGVPTVLRVPAHRPLGLGYPPNLLGPTHPWFSGLPTPPYDRPTALAPHYPTLDRLAGENFFRSL